MQQAKQLVEAALACGSTERAFAELPVADALNMLHAGVHPRHLPRKLYAAVAAALPTHLHLFRPQHVLPEDLLQELSRRRCGKLFAEHLAYHTSYVVQHADYALLCRCIPYMNISDDDVRLIEERFPNNVDNVLVAVNARSVPNINAAFTDEMIEAIVEARPEMAAALYATRPLDLSFLKRMLAEHGVPPINEELAHASPLDAVELLAQLSSVYDVRRTLDGLRHSVLQSETVKAFVLDRIRNKRQVLQYLHYAREYLRDRVFDTGPFGPIFVPAAYLNVDSLSREDLAAIADFPEKYDAEFMWKLALERSFHEVLAKLIRLMPVDAITEDVCVAVVRSGQRIAVADMCVHTRRVAEACVEMELPDVADLLDTVPLSALLAMGADLFASDYVFSTAWFNDRPELAEEYVRRFSFCGPRLARLLFGYPLKPSTLKRVYDALCAPNAVPDSVRESLGYLVSQGEMRLRPVGELRWPRESDEIEEGYEQEVFSSEHSARLAVCLNAYAVPGLRGYATADLVITKHASGSVILQLLRAYKSDSAVNKVLDHVFDVSRMARHGLFLLPDMFTPGWTPVLDLARGAPARPPPVLKMERLSFSPSEMVGYHGLGRFALGYEGAEGPCSDHQMAMDALFRCLFVHLAVGVRLTEKVDVCAFVRLVLAAFADGLCVERYTEPVEFVEQELTELRAWGPGERVIESSRVCMRNTTLLCQRVCARFAMYNNRVFKK
ncbi:hypothetical protein SePPVgORF012 [Seal parapoxvirus]|uniref:Uncharacterized protein n=1 Tax=Seal parapoxvirus TaxID=187984 RepID=A0A1Z3GCX5_9POXV|nr:hypothetical protein CGV03_gp012 [Seal parapoxvirus]ASC55616.1 hypothetical protein SePPVgORF012 [Seal parapoxvirus]